MAADHAYYMHVGGFSCTNLQLIHKIGVALDREPRVQHVNDRPGHDVKYELLDPMAITEVEFDQYLAAYCQSELRAFNRKTNNE
jgi:dTDP-D-glucose 4,6-dehydratase